MSPTSRDDENRNSNDRRARESSSRAEYSKEFSEAIGRTIKVLRTDLGIERKELAEMVGISYSYLTEIENGKKPASSTILRPIAHALSMRLSQLTEAAERRLEAGDSPALYKKLAMEEPDALRAHMGPPDEDEFLAVDASSPPRYALDASPSIADDPADALALRDYKLLQSRAPMRPSMRGQYHEIRAAILELERLVERMAPDDIERLLDYARRLSR